MKGLFEAVQGTALENYTPEQALYIKEYTAGLLVTWTKAHIDNLISPDVGDGFDAPEGVFTSEEEEWDAHSAVCQLLDNWLAAAIEQAGLSLLDEIVVQGDKYPPTQLEG